MSSSSAGMSSTGRIATAPIGPRRAFVSHYCNAPLAHRLGPRQQPGRIMKALTPRAPPITGIFWRAARPTCPMPSPASARPAPQTRPELYGERFDDNRVKSMMGDGSGFMVLVPHVDVEHDH